MVEEGKITIEIQVGAAYEVEEYTSTWIRIGAQHDIVCAVTFPLNDSEVRFDPVHTISRFGVVRERR